MECKSLFMTPEDMSGTLPVMNMYVCGHLDPMGAIWTKGSTWTTIRNWPQQRPAEAPSWRPAMKNNDARQSAPANDKIDREGSAFQTATDAEFAARGENSLPATHGRN